MPGIADIYRSNFETEDIVAYLNLISDFSLVFLSGICI